MRDCPVEIITRRGNIKYLDSLREIAREFRKNQTETEELIWHKCLRKKQTGFVFLRQKPFSRFILDFYCSELLLAVEVDGAVHIKQKIQDNERDEFLQSCGVKTIRIAASIIENDLMEARRTIFEAVNLRAKDLPFSKGETPDQDRGRGI